MLEHRPKISVLVAQVSGLLLFGIALERGFVAFERWIPREIYFEPSFTTALFAAAPLFFLIALLALSPALLSFLATRNNGRDALGWIHADSIGGLRWVAFCVVVSLCWSHAAYPYNYYYGQAHALDRWLLILLGLGILRSPLLIPLFVLELMVSRGQLRHPVGSLMPITDELPIRLLCIMAGTAFWNLIADSKHIASWSQRIRPKAGPDAGFRISTPVLVYAMLCVVGSYYAFAGVAKLTIGESVLDWARYSHLENLFVGAYLNGWPLIDSRESLLSMAKIIESLSVPIATATIIVECGMIFILVHRLGTIALVSCILMMHLGIYAMTGILFWQWVTIDIVLAIWLWWIREDESIGMIYSPANALISVILMVAVMWGVGANRFTWWNTRWYSVIDVEVWDREGHRYRVDYGDFYPFMLIDFLQPRGATADTILYGVTFSQKLMERIQTTNPRTLRATLRKQRAENASETMERENRNVRNFMLHYFQNRNRRMARGAVHGHHVFPFVISPPPLHMRTLTTPDVYRDQSPVVRVEIRHIESYYTGEAIVPFEDQVIHSIAIPPLQEDRD